jgi:hypothetical protein
MTIGQGIFTVAGWVLVYALIWRLNARANRAQEARHTRRRLRLPPLTTEGRWARINEAKRLAGCRCGRPATRVRFYGPAAVWSCGEHVGVNAWSQGRDGVWHPHRPTPEEAASLERWRTEGPRPYTDIDRLRGGTI